MVISFDSDAAVKLIKQMDVYCESIINNTKELSRVISSTNGWNDNQRRAFEENINSLKKDLNVALRLETDYIRTYAQRVKELEG